MDYNKMLKKDLVAKAEEFEQTIARQETTIARYQREKGVLEADKKKLQSDLREAKVKLEKKVAAPPKSQEVLEDVIKKKDEVIKKLAHHLESYIGLNGDAVAGLKAFINMYDNNNKSLLDEIKRG